MKKTFFTVVSLFFLLCSCGPPGVVVFERQGGQWAVKEIHVDMGEVNDSNIQDAAEKLNTHAGGH